MSRVDQLEAACRHPVTTRTPSGIPQAGLDPRAEAAAEESDAMARQRRRSELLCIPAISTYQAVTFAFRTLTTLVVTVPPWLILEALVILALHCFFVLPFELARSRWRQRNVLSKRLRTTWLQDVAYAIVRLGFGYFDYRIDRVFFSTTNSEKLTMQRLGYQKFIRSVRLLGSKGDPLRGWWVARHADLEDLYWGNGPAQKRLVILFVHGGGFATGSPSFYLEFLVTLRDTLAGSHPSLRNCAIFAPFYPLAPDEIYPAQVISIERSWQYLAQHPGVDPSRLTLLGDSAGGGLCVALMSGIAKGIVELRKPSQTMCVLCDVLKDPITAHDSLMSPWLDLHLKTDEQPSLLENATWDFVEPTSLANFSSVLLNGKGTKRHIGLIRWLRDHTLNLLPFFHARSLQKYTPKEASTFHFPAVQNLPPNGTLILSGKREILDSQICQAVQAIGPTDQVLHWRRETGVHAWPLTLFILGRDSAERAEGISAIVSFVVSRACTAA